jgi:C-terminal processing protease CtpA/Prc
VLRAAAIVALFAGVLAAMPASSAAEFAGWFGMSLKVDAGGFLLSPTINSATILEVAPHSPAEAAGLRAGDAILEIEGLTVAGGKANELRAALAKSVGQLLRLRLRRPGGETYSAVLTAARRPVHGDT